MYICGKIIITRGRTLLSGLPCAEGEKYAVKTGVRDVGGTTSKRERERERKKRGSRCQVLTRVHLRTSTRVCVYTFCGFFRACFARVQYVLSTMSMDQGDQKNDVKGYRRMVMTAIKTVRKTSLVYFCEFIIAKRGKRRPVPLSRVRTKSFCVYFARDVNSVAV